jgi:hypothetical protein
VSGLFLIQYLVGWVEKGLKAVTLSSAETIIGREAAQSILIDIVNEAGTTFICDETKEFINE